MSFHWSCFIVPSCLEICSFITIFVYRSLFHVYAQKKKKKKTKKKQKKNKKKTKKKKNKNKMQKQKEEKKKKKRKEKKNINKCARICIQYKYSLSSYVDL